METCTYSTASTQPNSVPMTSLYTKHQWFAYIARSVQRINSTNNVFVSAPFGAGASKRTCIMHHGAMGKSVTCLARAEEEQEGTKPQQGSSCDPSPQGYISCRPHPVEQPNIYSHLNAKDISALVQFPILEESLHTNPISLTYNDCKRQYSP